MPINDTPAPPPPTSEAESRLDRISRDLSRTLLHGSRVTDTAGQTRPATVATGQQLRVDLPDEGPMNFTFTVGDGPGAPRAKLMISHDDAAHSQEVMSAVTNEATKARYLTLSPDDIPTWVFQQKEFSLPDKPGPEEFVDNLNVTDVTAVPPASRTVRVARLPAAPLVENTTGSSVSLWKFDRTTQKGTAFPLSNWQPAILLRFPLKIVPSQTGAASAPVFELQGAPQGDRFYLDQLFDPAAPPPGPGFDDGVEIFGVALTLEKENQATPVREQITEWTISRTNLTAQGRSGGSLMNFAPFAPLMSPGAPYVAVSGVGPAQDRDAVRLLQMASITNSGGYYLRATATLADATTLILSVVLKTKSDASPDPKLPESGKLPVAANALAYLGASYPDTVLFNGLGHIQSVPFAPPGVLSFGWTRMEPDAKATDEDKFGFGTVSLVEYSALDKAGQFLVTANTSLAISPANPLNGDLFDRNQPQSPKLPSSGVHNLHTGDSAAMRLLAPHHLKARGPARMAAAAPGDLKPRSYRTTLTCYDRNTESPYTRFKDPPQRQISFAPGFRDVFGNRFEALPGATVLRRLFYTDTLIPPAEWPGVRFSVCPSLDSGKPVLKLEMTYRLLSLKESTDARDARIKRLKEIVTQLNGVDGDIAVSFSAAPLLKGSFPITPSVISSRLAAWIVLEQNNTTEPTGPIAMNPPFTVACDGQIASIGKFEPKIQIARANPDYCPHATDLPSDGTLAATIAGQVTSAASGVELSASAAMTIPSSDLSQSEFKAIAQAFQATVATPFAAWTGFLRNRVNQHELWFIPKGFLPTAPSDPAASADWSFATARPISNKLGTDQFVVPDFSKQCADPTGASCWQGFPLTSIRVVDQDFDQLGRIALAAIETETAAPDFITARDTAESMRSLLASREALAKGLAVFDGGMTLPYLVPMYATPQPIDTRAITRTASDAFLRNLNSFYSVDTILQPIVSPANPVIGMLEGDVTPHFKGGTPPKPPVFSDVLLAGGETRITILYDLPAGVKIKTYTEIPGLDSLDVSFTHVQLSNVTGGSSFNTGNWLELATPWTQTWQGSGNSIPVALRSFPAKPVLQDTQTTLATLPDPVDAAHASLLVKWGWQFTCSLEGVPNDTLHISVRYNEPPSPSGAAPRAMAPLAEWQPVSILHCLVVLKLLRDNWTTVPEPVRLQIVTNLAASLFTFLCPPVSNMLAMAALQPKLDQFTLPTGGVPAPVNLQVMQSIRANWNALSTVATVSAPADGPGNNALVTGTDPVRNYRASLRLLRNEAFGSPADPRLIFECAPVESALECWAHNFWVAPLPRLTFQTSGLTLQDALTRFFKAIFNNSDLSAFALEVGTALSWRKRALSVVTPFSILPADIVPAGGTADAVANLVLAKSGALLGSGVPGEVTSVAIRLRVKISENKPTFGMPGFGGIPPRTLLEIAAIDFPLKPGAALDAVL